MSIKTTKARDVLPKTLSATAAEVYENCPKRFEAEYLDNRARTVQGDRAGVGTVCHSVAENYVSKGHYLSGYERSVIEGLYEDAYYKTFADKRFYTEGLSLCLKWAKRQDFSDRTVLSVEKRGNFHLKTTAGAMPFVFVMDRLDRLNGDLYEIEVVDYKTISQPVSTDDLHNKIQARAYAVAAQIQHPDADRIWVTFDLLRFDRTVSTMFSRNENRENFRYLTALANRIVADEHPVETLNPECRWCVRKHQCTQMINHTRMGGPLSITDPVEAAIKRFQLESAKKAIEGMINDLDEVVLQYARNEETLAFDAGDYDVEITAANRRAIDSERASHVLGSNMMAAYGRLTLSDVDEILKDNVLPPEKAAELKSLIRNNIGEPKVKVKRKKSI